MISAVLLGLLALVLVAAGVWMNYDALNEAYGSGPPYHGRTTNMDKWGDPIPGLLVLDAVLLVLAAALGGLGALLAIGASGRRKAG